MVLQATATLFGLTPGSAATAAVLCVLVVVWWELGSRCASLAMAEEPKRGPFDSNASTSRPEAQRHAEARPADTDLSIDVEAFQSQIGHQCDLELEALRESVRDGQIARIPLNLEDELEGAPAAAAPPPPKPGPDFEAFQKNTDLYYDMVLEGMCSHTLDDHCESVLKTLEDECQCSSALDDDTQGEHAEEMEGALTKEAAGVWVTEGCSTTIAGIFDAALEEYHQTLMGELESMTQPMHYAKLLELIIERVRKAGEFLLWVI